ncbi:MAG: hypothetical protein M3Q93_07025, partial [Gemmatimonadota bacterium]|nr:hypothetical protein [Gemmatimonadota bacterium]
AGLYLLRLGAASAPPRSAAWFAKPAGMSYTALYALLAPLVDAEGAALWGRQMVLGPAPEFCLHTLRPVRLPGPLSGVSLDCCPVWP